jgi:hypothetical protein
MMAITLKDETILDQWSALLDGAAGSKEELLRDVERRLKEAQIPGDCSWEMEEVKSSGWLSKVRREFLIVRLRQFDDYRIYVGVRDYGISLDVCRFLTVEPGKLKKLVSGKLTGDDTALSGPKNILIAQDLRAWLTVIHHAVLNAVGSLMDRLGQDRNLLPRKSQGMLEVW